VFGTSNTLLRDAMIGIFLELGLPAAQLTEATTTVFRANGLQALAAQVVASGHERDQSVDQNATRHHYRL